MSFREEPEGPEGTPLTFSECTQSTGETVFSRSKLNKTRREPEQQQSCMNVCVRTAEIVST